MFSWSKLEVWLAVTLAGLIVIGGTGHLLLTATRGSRPIVVEARAIGEDVPEASTAAADAGGTDGAMVALQDGEGERVDALADEGTPSIDERININTAQPSELQRLPGIGPALAARIVAYRDAWGPFDRVEDIMEVSGIGPVKFANMKHLIKVR